MFNLSLVVYSVLVMAALSLDLDQIYPALGAL